MNRVRVGRAASAACAVVVLGGGAAACDGGGHDTAGGRPSVVGSPSAASTGSATSPTGRPDGTPSCPTTYAAPDPRRPRMDLAFTIDADHTHVTGRERVEFTPDAPITELVFRLTANSPDLTAASATSTTVLTAGADHGGQAFTVSRAGAAQGTQGGLLRIPFGSRVAAGTTVTATITFTLTVGAVGAQDFPRVGRTGGFTYFGSGAPLLAWQRGFGWHTEDLVGFPAETATSEAMDVHLSVAAPAADTVIMSGDPTLPAADGATRTWRSHIATARDVSVAAGPFVVGDTTVQGVRLRVGAVDAPTRDRLVPQFRRAITDLAARFGPYPFPSLSVARVPVTGGGIEYPSSILLLDDSRAVAVHETAHQWFYAMVGDSQALHPWLDEAFAQYAEELVDGSAGGHAKDLTGPDPVDASVQSYGSDSSAYYFTTYDKGSAALEAARRAAGPGAWDAALRCYVAANAWRIVTPADLRRALVGLPAAVAVLRRAGALPA